MPYDYTDVDVKCPFFKGANNNINTDDSLVCEGIVYNHTLTIIKFQSKKNKRKYREFYCCNKYKNCRYYIALMKIKYLN